MFKLAVLFSYVLLSVSAFSLASYPVFTTHPVQYTPTADTAVNHAYKAAEVFRENASYDSAIFYYKKASITFRQHHHWEQWAQCYNKIGECFIQAGSYNEALAYLDTARTTIAEKLSEEHLEMANTYNNSGHAYRAKGDYEKALAYQKQALDIRIDQLGENHALVATSYNNLGIIYRENGDHERALEYQQKALSIRLATLGSMHTEVAASYQNIGTIYSEKNDFEQALVYYEKALVIDRQIFGENHPYLSGGYYNMGIAYKEQKEFDKALEHFQKALAIDISIFGEHHPYIVQSYLNVGSVLAEQGKYDESLRYLQKATDICLQKLEASNPLLAVVYMETGKLYSQQNNFEEALHHYQKALMTIVPDFDNEDVYTNPTFENVNSKRLLLAILGLKAESLGKQTSMEALKAAMKTYASALDLITTLRTGYEAAGSKYLLSSEATKIYNKAIPTALKLYETSGEEKYKYDAFLLAERNKAGILIETLVDLEAKKSVGVPDSILALEREIDTNIAFYSKEVQKLYQGALPDSNKIEEYQQQIFALKAEKTKLIADIQSRYPNYYELKYDVSSMDVTDFQNNYMDPDQSLVSYFLGNDSIYLFGLTKYNLAYVTLPKSKNFEHGITALLQSINARDFEEFSKQAYATYQALLSPILSKVIADSILIHRLIIIPDGILGYVPFETLIQQPPYPTHGYKDLHYLLKDYQITYHYTASLIAMEHIHQNQPNNTFIGFAPTFRDDTGQQLLAFNETVRSYIDSARALPYAEEEVKAIASLLGGNAYTGALATERSFKQDAGNYSIIHLASHSLVDDTDPLYSKLIFDSENDSIEDGLLHTYELYNMQLNADLVTLSACNTGVGKYYKGEGIVSLARGFMYAGVPNVMMSLWSVADRPTKDIMQYFYEELGTGTPYASALHKAKLRYLEKADNLTSDPYYWGAFIYLGQPIDHTGQSVGKIRWVIGFVLIVCLMAGGVIFMKKKYLR